MISVFELFKIGIGPSSSHTVGPMKAAGAFVAGLPTERVARVKVTLFGSLAFTGKGHATDRAIILGLAGQIPETVDSDHAEAVLDDAATRHRLLLAGRRAIDFDPADIVFDFVSTPPRHPNTMTYAAYDADGALLREETWLSIGGGFIVRDGETLAGQGGEAAHPHPFRNAADLLLRARGAGLTIAELVWENETSVSGPATVEARLDAVIGAMFASVDRGLAREGSLPGGLKVRRRAKAIFDRLTKNARLNAHAAHEIMDYVAVYAMAVNEENAAGGRVVTAPTNGAAGVIPAVMRYYRDHCSEASVEGLRTFVLTAAAIGALFKLNASISGAEVGCQGEVGVASSMAAAGLCACLGGSNAQIENAAEIAMEHHLGMTCDPIGGLVQIPCIERNAFGAVKAIAAASLALHGDGSHKVSLDSVIATMRQTGADMQSKYKETSLGGLAVNFVEC
jgi:L-serine dehydratase